MSNPTPIDSLEPTLHRKRHSVDGVDIETMRKRLFYMIWEWFKENRFYSNWRTTDQEDEWTAKDFTLVTPENSTGSLAMDVSYLVGQFLSWHATQTAKLQAEARLDEIQKIVAGETITLTDIYGDDWRNNYGYNETQVRDAARYLQRRWINRAKERIAQLEREHKVKIDESI